MKVLDNAGIPCKVKPIVSKSSWLIGVLGIIIVILLARLIKLLLWRKKHYSANSETDNSEDRRNIGRRTPLKATSQMQKISLVENEAAKASLLTETDRRSISGRNSLVESRIRPKASLTQLRTNKLIYFEKNELILGKRAEMVDFAVGDNNKVSRRHAQIYWIRESGYVIKDLDSSNGTFVNGIRVPATGTVLKSGDLIRLADEEFEFRLLH